MYANTESSLEQELRVTSRFTTAIRYTPSMKKQLQAATLLDNQVQAIGVDSQTGFIYLVVADEETVLYFSLLGDEAIAEMLGLRQSAKYVRV